MAQADERPIPEEEDKDVHDDDRGPSPPAGGGEGERLLELLELPRPPASRRLPVVARVLLKDAMQEARRARGKEEWHFDRANKTLTTLSLIVVTTVATVAMLVWLRGVLIPFVLALILAFLLEPVLFLLLRPVRRFVFGPEAEGPATTRPSGPSSREGSAGGPREATVPRLGFARSLVWRLWSGVAVISCILIVGIVIVGCLVLIFQSITAFDWAKYNDSVKLRRLLQQLEDFGAQSGESIVNVLLKGPLLEAVNVVLTIISTLLLMALFLAFLLFHALSKDPHARSRGLGSRVKRSVQRYLRIKVVLSSVVGLLVWLIYAQAEVDLAFLFAFLTFLLNHIPQIGYTISVLLPLPLVLLDPTKGWEHLAACIVWPMIVHQMFSNIVEPRLLSLSLDLHPVVVLVSLAFWTLCWGAVGAVLSTPLTCMLRLALNDVDHPAARGVVQLLTGKDVRPPGSKR